MASSPSPSPRRRHLTEVAPSKRQRPLWVDLIWITLVLLTIAIGMTIWLAQLDPEGLSRGFDSAAESTHQSDAALPDLTRQAAP